MPSVPIEPNGAVTPGKGSLLDQEEGDLIQSARSGDSKSFAELVLRHQDRVFHTVRRMVRDVTLAEDLTQDVFVRAWRNLGSFREESVLATWLYRIAVNLCCDYQSSKAARARRAETSLHDPGLAGFDPPSPEGRPDHRREDKEMAALFLKTLESLDADYRAAFVLRHQEDRNYEEIAEILEISVANAKVRVHRAREMILKLLRQEGLDL